MISGVLEVLDGCFTLYGNATTDENKTAQRTVAVEVATQLLTLPTPVCVQLHTKCLLAALHTTRAAYHSYKVWLIPSGVDWCVLCILFVPCLSHLRCIATAYQKLNSLVVWPLETSWNYWNLWGKLMVWKF